jgi:ABC-type polysaccharide/polyol phosphate export systems, permease component
MNAEVNLTIIEPKKGWVPIDFKALWLHRELLYFLAKRDVKVRYKQTVLGGLWAIIQPLFTMLVFSIFFGRLAKIPSDGIPYPVFVYAALVPWTYFANASGSGNSLVGSANLITKVYFPRLIVPAAASIAGLLDFAIALSILAILMVYYHIMPGPALLLFPFLVVLTFLCAVGVGLWLSALNVQYRDIRYAIPFLIQLWLFLSPVIYPASMINAHRRWLMALNPMAGVIEAYRASLFNKLAVNWSMLGISTIMIIILFTGGLYYFRRMEKSFADLV